jgi:hypothetical protein
MTALTAGAGLIAAALVVVRRRLGPVPPSKVPSVLAWIFGVLGGLSVLTTVLLAVRLGRHGFATPFPLALHTIRPSEDAAVTFVAWATVLIVGRRRATRPFAVVPLAFAIFAVSGPHLRINPPSTVDLRHIPLDGAAVAWDSTSRPASVLRTAQFPAEKYQLGVVVSPGGRLFFSRFFDKRADGSRVGIRVRDFAGHAVEIDAASAAFVDDERMLILRRRAPSVELSEIRPFSSTAPSWSRVIPELEMASVEIEPGGKTILLVGNAAHTGAPAAVRTSFGPEAPRETLTTRSRYPDADAEIGFFVSAGKSGQVVSRLRARLAPSATGRSPFVASDLRPDETGDVELWAIGPDGETLLSTHVPDLECLGSRIGHPSLWCPVGWDQDHTLLKVDAAAGRVSQVAGAMPPRSTATLLGPSKLAVLADDHRVGVVDLDARRGVWLTLPPAVASTGQSPSRGVGLADGALAMVTSAREGQVATLTVFTLP